MSEEQSIPEAQGPEKSVLSTMMKHPSYIAKAQAEKLSEAHFHRPQNAAVFRAIIEAGEFEARGFVEDLHRRGKLEDAGGSSHISEILTYATTAQHWDDHVQRLRVAMARRRIIAAASEMKEEASVAEPEDLQKMLARVAESTADALRGTSRLLTARAAAGYLAERMKAIASGDESAAGWKTGLDPIDLATGGARPGQLWVIAGETSGGKSVALLQSAQETSKAGGRVLIVSLEMEAWEIMARLASCRGSIPFHVFMDPGRANKHDLGRAQAVIKELAGERLAIDDRGGHSPTDIEAMATEFAETHGGIDMIIVDYIQLVDSPRKNRSDTREMEISAATKALKALAKKMGCPVLTASQLNDQGRLRESRAIGHDSDVVLAIGEDGIKGVKLRNAPRGQLFPLFLNGDKQRFEQREIK